MSPAQATTYTGGRVGLPMAGPSHSTLSPSGTPAGPSHTTQTASSMVGTGGPTGGVLSQQTGVPSGQGSGPSTRVPPTRGSALQGTQPSRSGSSGSSRGTGGGGSGSSSGGGGPPAPPLPPGGQAVVQGVPIAGPLPAANGVLRGHPPKIFDGQQKNTQKFVKEFTL